MCCVAQPPQASKYGQNGVSRSGEATSTLMRRACDPSRSTVTVSPGSTLGTKTGPEAPSAVPSAFAPRRLIVTCSATTGSQQKLAIAVPALDGRGDKPHDLETERGDEGCHVLADRAMHGSVAHDALLHMIAPRLELRLHEHGQFRA